MDVPAGTIIEFALAEYLTEGRVSPYINLSGGPSCNLDRFIARGGEQTFRPLTPLGGRFLEVHVVNARLITPYFAHYVMPLLIERGRMDFVLEQYRKCWGESMLAGGRTTWIEVFDTRWSHCHQ